MEAANAALEDAPAALVNRAQTGDDQAEKTLLLRFAPAVRAFARRRLRSQEAVDEFTQDALLVFLEALRRGAVEEPERVGGFVLGICRQLSADRAKQRERRSALWEKFSDGLAILTSDAPAGPTYEVIHLEDCLSELSQRACNVVRLAYVEGQSHSTIAASLAISEANARVLRHRTLEALRHCMSKRISWETT